MFRGSGLPATSAVRHAPGGATWAQLLGACVPCGVGFTMSLFIGGLGLPAEYATQLKLGVLVGSFISGILGSAILSWARPTGEPATA